ncbi:transglycosylase domain-containing protein [Leptospira dzoumogneensis]|uniref:Penicillin-binding protein n=1 Tax=Leptospira dzoumogneensis TaxID=2484904 RepID=A0A4Z1AFS8_9LEPT|nr:transglycosylase domain-containing protein [Leptospira dzoumogneensis]TGN02863.1 penicillin-binding protein [Leptospira dzoumogneensis]
MNIKDRILGILAALLQYSRTNWRSILKFSVISGIVILSFLIGGSYVVWLTKQEEVARNLETFQREVSDAYDPNEIKPIRILDKNGKLIGEFSRRKFRPIRTDNLANHGNIIWALLSSEDRDFYEHNGVNFTALLRAIIVNLTTFQKQGGSTLTQQLAKLTLDLGARNVFNKLTEFYCTFYLESKFDKNTILAMYLNRIFLGEGNTGVEEASRYYFNKPAYELTPAEAALLVGTIPAPSNYNAVRNPKIALKRQKMVMTVMGKNQNLHPNPKSIERDFEKKVDANIRKFRSFYVVEETKEEEDKVVITSEIGKYGFDKDFTINLASDFNFGVRQFVIENFSEIDLESRGMNVYTTLDYDKQEAAERSLREGIEAVRKKLSEEKANYIKAGKTDEAAKQNKIIENMNGSLISINPANGYVEAMVGSYKISNIFRLNRAVSAVRQPGSVIKGLVYLMAFEKRIATPTSIVVDEPIKIRGYAPKNWYKGHRGAMQTRTAFAQSVNTIAVKFMDEIGVGDFIHTLGKILDLDSSELSRRFQHNLTLALGSGELSPKELATVYATIANNGKKVKPVEILRITDFEGSELYVNLLPDPKEAEQILDPVACAMTLNLLEAVVSEEGTLKIALKEGEKFPLGGKTGTVQSPKEAQKRWGSRKGVRDVWFAGVNPNLVTAVWVGNDLGAPFPGSGSGTSGSIWFRYVSYVARTLGFGDSLITPFNGDYVKVDICAETGGLLSNEAECKHPLYGQYYYVGDQPGGGATTPTVTQTEGASSTNGSEEALSGEDAVELELPEAKEDPSDD